MVLFDEPKPEPKYVYIRGLVIPIRHRRHHLWVLTESHSHATASSDTRAPALVAIIGG